MEYRRLGRTGLKVSTICLGTMQFGWSSGEDVAHRDMSRAVELGCNFFDTADVYSRWIEGNPGGVSETIIGNWLQKTSARREDLIIATKVRGATSDDVNDRGLSRHHIMNAVENSLRRLQTDYIDLYQTHAFEAEAPQEETLRALDDLVHQGKVRYVGVSNYPAWRLAEALWISDVRYLVRYERLQPHYNLVHRAEFERELQPLCLEYGIGVIPYSPLGGGFLTASTAATRRCHTATGRQASSANMNEQGFAAVDKLEEIGSAHGATIAQTAIAWVLANPAVDSAIIGANSVEQLEDTLKGAEISLTAEEKAALDEVTAWQERR